MIQDISRARDEALAAVGTATTVEDLDAVVSERLGKRGPLSGLKARLGSLATIEEKKATGQALNEAMAVVGAAPDTRRSALAPRSAGPASEQNASTSANRSAPRAVAMPTS